MNRLRQYLVLSLLLSPLFSYSQQVEAPAFETLPELKNKVSRALTIPQKSRYLRYLLEAYRYHSADTCTYYVNQLSELTTRTGDSIHYAWGQTYLAFNLSFHFENFKAYQKLYEALTLFKKLKNDEGICRVHADLSYCFLKKGNLRKNFEHARKSMLYGQKLPEYKRDIPFHYYGTSLYQNYDSKEWMNYDSSVYYLQRAAAVTINPVRKIISMGNLIYKLSDRLPPSELINMALNNLKQSEEIEFDWGIMEAYTILAYLHDHNRISNEKVIAYADSALKRASKLGDKWAMEQSMRYKIRATLRDNNIPGIVNLIWTKNSLIEKRINEEYNQQLAELEATYRLKERENQIARQEQRIYYLTLVIGIGIIMLLSLIGGIYYFRKLSNKNARLSARIKLLLKEQNHRVKNHLQMVSSLLSLQSNHLAAGSARDALGLSESRVNSIAALHQMLYQTDDTDEIQLKQYVQMLVDEIAVLADRKVSLDAQVPEGSFVKIEKAASIGLLINELLLNSIKHAKTDQHLTISITISRQDRQLHLEYQDNGNNFDIAAWDESTSFGHQLIKIQSKQLGGSFEIGKDEGFHYRLSMAV